MIGHGHFLWAWKSYVWRPFRWVMRAAMENNAQCSWPVDGPSPLSTDIDEIVSYMRVAHTIATSRDRRRSSMGRTS